MKNKAFNTQSLIWLINFAVFVTLTVWCISVNAALFAVVFGVVAALLLYVILITPVYTEFDAGGITVVYMLVIRDRIEWRAITRITQEGSWHRLSEGTPYYEITCKRADKPSFLKNGRIPKTRKTQRLVQSYWKDEIKIIVPEKKKRR